uniref:G-protein coupled receptors family 1 profile domain-containing protein n=1 Tax=Ascaris lumbricoides TaxID=6252 RepID=A0A0M3INL6_ASCLU
MKIFHLIEMDIMARNVGGIIFLLLTTMGIFANSILVMIFVNGREYFTSNFFYLLSYQLIICDFLIYISQLALTIPACFLSVETFTGKFIK